MTARSLILVCVVTAAWAVSFGLGTQAASHWLKLHGASDTLIGLVHAFYYLGVAGMSFAVPGLSRRLGLGCASLGMFLSAVSLAMFPFAGGAFGWLLLRLVSGAGCALSLIPLETYLSRCSPPDRRTETFSYYAVALTLAGALGIALGLEWFNADGVFGGLLGQPRNAFFVGAVFPLLGSIITQHGLARLGWEHEASAQPFQLSWKTHFLSFGTAWGQGFLEGGMLAFLSLYLVSQGLTTSAAGVLMSVTMVGVIIFQIPVAWLADRLGRVTVLLGCYGVTVAGLIAVPCCESLVWLGFWLFLFGACSGAMYPLGLSLLGDKLPTATLARAYAWYMAMECVGSQLGAAAMGKARDMWGEAAMFGVGALGLVAVLGVWAVVRRANRERHPDAEAEDIRRAA